MNSCDGRCSGREPHFHRGPSGCSAAVRRLCPSCRRAPPTGRPPFQRDDIDLSPAFDVYLYKTIRSATVRGGSDTDTVCAFAMR